MSKIIDIAHSEPLAKKLRENGKTIVLAGGCFDILHIGHITFLEKAGKKGDILILMLESDKQIKKFKGENRPINSQEDRARILASLECVDYIVLLKPDMNDKDYDDLVIKLNPNVIATTVGDQYEKHKKRQAKLIKAKLIRVTDRIVDKSTTRLIKLLGASFA